MWKRKTNETQKKKKNLFVEQGMSEEEEVEKEEE